MDKGSGEMQSWSQRPVKDSNNSKKTPPLVVIAED